MGGVRHACPPAGQGLCAFLREDSLARFRLGCCLPRNAGRRFEGHLPGRLHTVGFKHRHVEAGPCLFACGPHAPATLPLLHRLPVNCIADRPREARLTPVAAWRLEAVCRELDASQGLAGLRRAQPRPPGMTPLPRACNGTPGGHKDSIDTPRSDGSYARPPVGASRAKAGSQPDGEEGAPLRVEVGFSDVELGGERRHVDAGAVPVERLGAFAEGDKGVRRGRHHLDRVGHLGLHGKEKGAGDEGTPVAVLLSFGIGVDGRAGIGGLGAPPRQPAVLLLPSRLFASSTPRASQAKERGQQDARRPRHGGGAPGAPPPAARRARAIPKRYGLDCPQSCSHL
jgi:hypothetical protein